MSDDDGRIDRAGSPIVMMSGGHGPWGDDAPTAVPVKEDGGGGEDRNPWKVPPKRRPRPLRGDMPGAPSIEELLRRGRARLGGGFPRGNGFGGRPIWGYALAAFVLLWLATTSIHRIDPGERGVVTRFGRYVATLQPGLGFTLPAPVDVVTRVDVGRVRSFDVPASGGQHLMLATNGDLVDLAYTVRWSVRDPVRYLFGSADREQLVRDVAESAMCNAIANVDASQANDALRAQIETQVAARTQALLDRYQAGIAIEGVTISKADPPGAVDDAAKDVDAARQQAQSDIAAARTYAQQMVGDAQTSSAAFDKVYAAYKIAPAVTRTRIYYQTMEAVLSKMNTVIVDAPGTTVRLPSPPVVAAPSATPSSAAATPAPAATGNGQ